MAVDVLPVTYDGFIVQVRPNKVAIFPNGGMILYVYWYASDENEIQ
jgi:hypothetical protein